jgi:hypothetical protein
MKKTDWIENRAFTRFLEILPGFIAWSALILPFLFAPIFPAAVAYFILGFNFYWFVKSINIMRHMIRSFSRMWKSMKVDWLDRCKEVSREPRKYKEQLLLESQETGTSFSKRNWQEIENLGDNYSVIKDWSQVYHAIFVTNFQEEFYITEPTYEAIRDCNFPNDHIIIVSCGEKRDEENYLVVKEQIQKKFGRDFKDILYFMHEVIPGEVKGKGSNLYSAGHKFMEYFNKEYPDIKPEDVLVTTLDADHIIHKEYLSNLTYKYIIDPSRHRKTYQPVALLFNNIWDAPAPSRLLAIASSFWQMVESVRTHRLRTFAAHTQSLKTLLVTDFWSNKTVVEDGHQYWRTYFAYNGDQEMVGIQIPVFQDCVLGESFFVTIKNQYLQRRRWAWGISDFPFIVKNFLRHPEINIGEKFLQTFRHIAGNISWSTASFLIAFAWVPLIFNKTFQDTVLAHNVSIFSSNMLRLAWVGIFANIWIFVLLLPPLPKHKKKTDYVGMLAQWLIAPVVTIFFSSLPALESQTRLLLGQSLDVFWVTPKVRVRHKD